jgi:hypothetical protein
MWIHQQSVNHIQTKEGRWVLCSLPIALAGNWNHRCLTIPPIRFIFGAMSCVGGLGCGMLMWLDEDIWFTSWHISWISLGTSPKVKGAFYRWLNRVGSIRSWNLMILWIGSLAGCMLLMKMLSGGKLAWYDFPFTVSPEKAYLWMTWAMPWETFI